MQIFLFTDPGNIPEGGKIALPNDVSNQESALILLEDAEFLTLVDDYDGLGSISKAVVESPKDLKLIETAPAQIPRALGDVDADIINNGIAGDASFNPVNDSIYHEDETATDYVEIIAVRSENRIMKPIRESPNSSRKRIRNSSPRRNTTVHCFRRSFHLKKSDSSKKPLNLGAFSCPLTF